MGAPRGQTPSSRPARIIRSARTRRASMAPRIRKEGWVAPPVRTVASCNRPAISSAKASAEMSPRDAPPSISCDNSEAAASPSGPAQTSIPARVSIRVVNRRAASLSGRALNPAPSVWA